MILYVCSQGRIRSRTAEVLTLLGGEQARSCGIDKDAISQLNSRLVLEADIIICMQQEHANAVYDLMASDGKRIEVMMLPDIFNPYDDHFINLLITNLRIAGLDEYAAAISRGRTSPHIQHYKKDY
jgi:predicted protein tyrosine phosphatase